MLFFLKLPRRDGAVESVPTCVSLSTRKISWAILRGPFYWSRSSQSRLQQSLSRSNPSSDTRRRRDALVINRNRP